MAQVVDSGVDARAGAEKPRSGAEKDGMAPLIRVEIDTSVPFESVKEAVSHFGGSAAWKPHHKPSDAKEQKSIHDMDLAKVEEQSSQLEKELIVKERETLKVLKELESTKRIVEELKLRLQKEGTAVDDSYPDFISNDSKIIKPTSESLEKEAIKTASVPALTPEDLTVNRPVEEVKKDYQNVETHLDAATSPRFILMELQQAKVNLSRTTNDLSGIRASVQSLNRKFEEEKLSLEKTRERLTSNSSKISSLEEELTHTRLKLKLSMGAMNDQEQPADLSKELENFSSEAQKYKRMAEAARTEVSKAMAEIEQTKTSLTTAEKRWHAARKMEEAARAAEAAALAEIKVLASSEDSLQRPAGGITLSYEEYTLLTRRAQEADELSKNRIEKAMLQVNEAEASKLAILKQVEKTSVEVKTSQKVLEEALRRVEAANQGKLAVEEALRKWRSDRGQKRRSLNSSTKFKNSYSTHNRKDSHLLDVNGKKSDFRPPLSIGQILSRKLMVPEGLENDKMGRRAGKPTVSLGQMLSKRNSALTPLRDTVNHQKQFSAKRKRFGFVKVPQLLANQKKKKKQAPNKR